METSRFGGTVNMDDLHVRERTGFATRWLGDDAGYAARPGLTSPPYPGIGLEDGEPLREDWFPVVWREGDDAAG